MIGQWVELSKEAIYTPRPTGIPITGREDSFILRDGRHYYLFCDLPMSADPNVALQTDKDYQLEFPFKEKICSIQWLDDGMSVEYKQQGEQVVVHTVPFTYGHSLVVRIAKIMTEQSL